MCYLFLNEFEFEKFMDEMAKELDGAGPAKTNPRDIDNAVCKCTINDSGNQEGKISEVEK